MLNERSQRGSAAKKAKQEREQRENTAANKVKKIVRKTGKAPHIVLNGFAVPRSFKSVVIEKVDFQVQKKKDEKRNGNEGLAPK